MVYEDDFLQWQSRFENTCVARKAEKEAWQKMARNQSADPKIKALRAKMRGFKRLFKDMITPENSFSYSDIAVFIDEKDETSPDIAGQYNWTDSIEWLYISPEFIERDDVILHEMLHMHIEKMAPMERVLYYPEILGKVKEKIPDLDILLGEKDGVSFSAWRESLADPHTHDNLYFIKSLDIDMRKNYQLGTVFGHFMPQVIAYILEGVAAFKDVRDQMDRLQVKGEL